jgi:hypothetical protein
MRLDNTIYQSTLERPNCLIFIYVGDTLVDYRWTKFEALSSHKFRETDGGTKTVKSVLGGIFCILQCCWHCIYVCFSALERVFQLILSVHMVKIILFTL